jgi:hypothetical protein
MSDPVVIPLFSDARFSQTVALDGSNYGLALAWNNRGQFWSLSISDGNGNLLKSGIRLNIAYPVKRQYNDAGLPSGDFFLMDPSDTTWTQETGRNDFASGRKLELWYVNKLGVTGAQEGAATATPPIPISLNVGHFRAAEVDGKWVGQHSDNGIDGWTTIMTIAG